MLSFFFRLRITEQQVEIGKQFVSLIFSTFIEYKPIIYTISGGSKYKRFVNIVDVEKIQIDNREYDESDKKSRDGRIHESYKQQQQLPLCAQIIQDFECKNNINYPAISRNIFLISTTSSLVTGILRQIPRAIFHTVSLTGVPIILDSTLSTLNFCPASFGSRRVTCAVPDIQTGWVFTLQSKSFEQLSLCLKKRILFQPIENVLVTFNYPNSNLEPIILAKFAKFYPGCSLKVLTKFLVPRNDEEEEFRITQVINNNNNNINNIFEDNFGYENFNELNNILNQKALVASHSNINDNNININNNNNTSSSKAYKALISQFEMFHRPAKLPTELDIPISKKPAFLTSGISYASNSSLWGHIKVSYQVPGTQGRTETIYQVLRVPKTRNHVYYHNNNNYEKEYIKSHQFKTSQLNQNHNFLNSLNQKHNPLKVRSKENEENINTPPSKREKQLEQCDTLYSSILKGSQEKEKDKPPMIDMSCITSNSNNFNVNVKNINSSKKIENDEKEEDDDNINVYRMSFSRAIKEFFKEKEKEEEKEKDFGIGLGIIFDGNDQNDNNTISTKTSDENQFELWEKKNEMRILKHQITQSFESLIEGISTTPVIVSLLNEEMYFEDEDENIKLENPDYLINNDGDDDGGDNDLYYYNGKVS